MLVNVKFAHATISTVHCFIKCVNYPPLTTPTIERKGSGTHCLCMRVVNCHTLTL